MSNTKVVLARDGFAPPRVFAGASAVQVAFSFAAMLGMCLVAWMFYELRPFNVDPDLWWHIKIGQRILETHQWPTVEQYSFTAPGQRWRAYEWLGEVLLAVVYRTGGLRGLGVLLVLLGVLFASALYYYTTIRCGNPKAGFLAAAVLLSLANWFNLRPQMLGYLFLLFTLIILEWFRQGNRRAIWLLPPLILLWVNTHGSWIIGLGAIGVYLVSGMIKFHIGSAESRLWNTADRRHLTIVFMMSLIAIFITPYGAGIATFPFQIGLSKVNVSNIQEWQPLMFTLTSEKLFLGLLLGFLVAQIALHPKWRIEELFLFVLAAGMTFLHVRFISLFVVFFAPVLVVILSRWIPKYERTKEVYALNAAIILGLAATIVWFFPSRADYQKRVAEIFPVAAVQYLNTHSVTGPMYNSYQFGGYLLWARGPEDKVFIDGRAEIYEAAGVLSDQIALLNLKPGSLAVLQKYNIQSCLLQPGEALATALSALPNWEMVYSDGNSVLFIRRQNDAAPGQAAPMAQLNHPIGGRS